ncbi:hypothetical protein ACIBW9_01775 [Streptomyces sp. NPDC049541]|uniref:hypothetical protein n=1 Tax=Streptomyces sp. NPDC049541 TaxID=3365594 RepID=UPI0037B92041
MAYRKRQTLIPSILTVLESMGVKAWVFEGRVAHDGTDGLRQEIADNIKLLRGKVGLRKSALFFGAVLLTAMDRGTFTPADIESLDDLGRGNALYLLEKLEEIEA